MYEKIIGEKFGMLKVLRRADTDFITKSGKPEPQYECLCDCGNTCLATRHYLLFNPRTQNCGCINPSKFKDMTGLKFGKLEVISRAPDRYVCGKQVTMWNCHCECGNDTVVSGHSLRNHHTESCGCGIREASFKHGDTGTKLYREWCGIKRRCYNQNHHSYKDYGARGITMCDEWKDDYLAFKAWAETQSNYEEFLNSKKSELSIDRMDNDKGYFPDNCRFATAKEQANNRRSNKLITHNGETLTVSQWADKAGLSQQAFNVRYNAGWTMDQILNTEKYSYIQRPEVDGVSHDGPRNGTGQSRHMEHGQDREGTELAGIPAGLFLDVLKGQAEEVHGGKEVPVADHDALAAAGGTRGKEDHRQGVHVLAFAAFVTPLGCLVAVQRQQLVPIGLLQGGFPVGKLAVVDDVHRLHQLDLVVDFIPVFLEVQGNQNAPRQQDRKDVDQIVVTVAGQQTDLLSLDVGFAVEQQPRRPADVLGVLAIADAHHPAFGLVVILNRGLFGQILLHVVDQLVYRRDHRFSSCLCRPASPARAAGEIAFII